MFVSISLPFFVLLLLLLDILLFPADDLWRET